MANDFQDSINHVLGLAPILTNYPGTAVALVQTPGITDTEVQAVAGLHYGREQRNFLEGATPDRREQEWARMSEAQRRLAREAGFIPPAEAPDIQSVQQGDPYAGFGGFLRHTKNAFGDVAGFVKGGVSKGLDAIEAPMDFVQHVGRANQAALLDDTGSGLIASMGHLAPTIGLLTSPHEIARYWRETSDGERSYDRRALEHVRSQFDAATFDMAKRSAEGEDLTSILNSAKSQEERDLYDQMSRNPILQEAVNAINNTKLGLGRGLARGLGIDTVNDQTLFKYTSGSIDAVNSLFTDPLLVGGKVAAAVKVGRYGIGTMSAERMDAVLAQGSVNRFFTDALPHINDITSGDDVAKAGAAFEQIQTRYKQVLPLLDAFRDYRQSELGRAIEFDDLANFFQGERAKAALFSGQAAVRGVLMPRKSLAGKVLGDNLRETMRKSGIGWLERPSQLTNDAINKTIDDLTKPELAEASGAIVAKLREQSKLRYRTGMIVSRFVEQDAITRDGTLDLLDSRGSKVVYNLARMYLPRWHANQVAGAYASADLGGRMQIYKGLMHSLGEAAGITTGDHAAEGKAWLNRFIADIDGGVQQRAFSAVRGNDVAEDGAQHALYPHQFATAVPLPSFKEMHEFASRVGMVSRLGGVVTAPLLDWFTSAWRPGVLLRPALAFRNAMEETTNAIARNGVWDFTRGIAARRAVDKAAKQYASTGMVTDIEYRLTHGLGRILNDDDRRYLREFASNDQALTDYLEGIRGTSTRGMSNATAGESAADFRVRRRGGREYEIKYKMAGKNFRPQDTLDGDGVRRWTGALRTLLQPGSPARTALAHLEDHDTAVANITDLILSEGFKRNRQFARRWTLPADVTEDNVGAQTEMAREWAEKIYVDVRAHFSDGQGNLLDDLVNDIRVRQPDGTVAVDMGKLTAQRLSQIDEVRRPPEVVSGDVIYLEGEQGVGPIRTLVEKGYEATGRLTGVLGKNNIHYANYLEARRVSAPWEQQLAEDLFEAYANRFKLDMTNTKKVEQVRAKMRERASRMVTEQASRTAEMQTLSYVDNPDVRSQASVILRNIVPFGRAQEEFYRRWGRTLRHHPETVRKLQMVYEGAQHSGLIQEDEEGNDIFVYPGSRQVQELMYHTGKLFGWDWAMSPVPHVFSSQVRFLNQGLDPKNIQPSFGPVAAVPIKAIEKIFPESTMLKEFNRTILGDLGSSQSNPLMQVMPTFVRRVYESGVFGNETEQLASSTKQSVVYLEAAGRTPPEGADPRTLEAYQEDIKTWSRVHLFMKALFGTTVPAAPQVTGAPTGAPIGDRIGDGSPEDDPGVYLERHRLIDAFRRENLPTVAAEFRAEIARTGDYNIALANWVRTRPNELPFTVGTSESTYGGHVPATKEAGLFYDGNRDLFDSYPAAAVLMMPQNPGELDIDVYRTELASGLRQKKSFEDFALDLKLVGNLQRYYDLKEAYQQRRGEAKAAGQAVTAIDEQWQRQAATFKATYPAVGKYLADYQERQADRARIMLELQRMVENDHVPDIPGKQSVALLVAAYNKRQSLLAQIGSGRSAADMAAKASVKASFQEYARRMAASDLNADMVYQRLLRGLEDD